MIGYSGSRALDDEHITMPISVGIPRSEHNVQLDLHVKHFRLSAVIQMWKAERNWCSYMVTSTSVRWSLVGDTADAVRRSRGVLDGRSCDPDSRVTPTRRRGGTDGTRRRSMSASRFAAPLLSVRSSDSTQTLTASLIDARREPSGLNATSHTLPPSYSTSVATPLSRSQRRIVPSRLLVATRLPSGENRTAKTWAE